jgi:hypothetical protein
VITANFRHFFILSHLLRPRFCDTALLFSSHLLLIEPVPAPLSRSHYSWVATQGTSLPYPLPTRTFPFAYQTVSRGPIYPPPCLLSVPPSYSFRLEFGHSFRPEVHLRLVACLPISYSAPFLARVDTCRPSPKTMRLVPN